MMRNVTPATLVLCFALFMGHASWAQPGTPSGGNYPAGQAGIDFNVNNANTLKPNGQVNVHLAVNGIALKKQHI